MSAGSLELTPSPQPASRPGEGAYANVHTFLDRALLLGAGLVLSSCAVLALCQLNTGVNLDTGSGVLMGLAAHLNAGRLYPPLYDGHYFGGTRYMPLQFLLQAGLARLTGEYVFSGKLLSLLLAVPLVLGLVALLRRLGCGRTPALALTALVVGSSTGLYACTTIRGDLLPVVCQLGALLAAWGRPSYRRVVLAALLCTLAFFSKLTALWAAPAIFMTFLVARDWRRAVAFAGAWLGSLAGGAALLHVVTAGRMLENFTALSGSGMSHLYVLARGPYRLFAFLPRGGPLLQALAPFLLLECGRAWRQRAWTVGHWSFLFCLPLSALIMADVGAVSNHLLDLVVTAALVVGALWAALRDGPQGSWGLRALVALSVLWGLGGLWAHSLAQRTFQAARDATRGTPSQSTTPLAGVVRANEPLLAEDPLVPVSLGQVPVVLDLYALSRLQAARPELLRSLVRRIENLEFAHVVLRERVEGRDYDRGDDWEAFFYGKAVSAALRAHYCLERTADGYRVLVPKGAKGPAVVAALPGE
jgi:hypothetical protein